MVTPVHMYGIVERHNINLGPLSIMAHKLLEDVLEIT